MSQDHRKLAEEFVALVDKHDADALVRLVAEDYVEHNPLVPDGREANRAFWAGFFAAFPDLTADLDDVLADGDRLVARLSYRGTHQGEFFGVPATGRPVHMRTINIWRVRDGLLAEHWDETSALEVLQQVGAIPPFGAA